MLVTEGAEETGEPGLRGQRGAERLTRTARRAPKVAEGAQQWRPTVCEAASEGREPASWRGGELRGLRGLRSGGQLGWRELGVAGGG